jgi:hypothetical protein
MSYPPLACTAGLNESQQMSPIDLALQRVAGIDEQLAAKLLIWLDDQQAPNPTPTKEHPKGARAMIGFALVDGRAPRPTADWMTELRTGDTY